MTVSKLCATDLPAELSSTAVWGKWLLWLVNTVLGGVIRRVSVDCDTKTKTRITSLWILPFLYKTSWDYGTVYQDGTHHGPLATYANLWVAHALGMPGTFSPAPQRVSDPDMNHGMCVTHVPWCMPGSLTSRWRGKRYWHSRCMRNPQFCVSGKRPMRHHSCVEAPMMNMML